MTSSYEILLDAVPRGKEYDAEGQIYPFRDGPTEFSWSLGIADSVINIYLRAITPGDPTKVKLENGVLVDTPETIVGQAQLVAQGVTNAAGELTAAVQLGDAPGNYELILAQPGAFDTPLVVDIITTRISATLQNAIGTVMDDLQVARNRLRNGISPTTADGGFLPIHGQKVGLARPTAWSANAYRAAIVAWVQSQRHFGGIARGLRESLAASRGTTGVLLPQAWLPGLDSGNLISQTGGIRPAVDDGGVALEVGELHPFAGPAFARHGGASAGGASGGALADVDFLWSRRLNATDEDAVPNANARSHACIHAAVTSTATPSNTFNLEITQPYEASIGGDGGIFSGTTFFATTTAARLTVLFTGVWAGGTVQITGRDADNVEQTENFAYSGAGLVHGEVYFKSITSITHTTATAGLGTASVGLRDRVFLRVVECSGVPLGVFDSGALTYTAASDSIALLSGDAVALADMSPVADDATGYLRRATLRGRGSTAYLLGLKDQATYNTIGSNRLRLSADHQPYLEIALTESAAVDVPTAVTGIAAQLNTALAASSAYGASYADFAAGVSTGVLRLRNPSGLLTYGSASQIRIEKSALCATGTSSLRGDFLKRVLGLPRAAGFLAATYSGGTTFSIDSVHTLPPASATDSATAWTGWLGRGQRANGTSNVVLTRLDDRTATLAITGAIFIPADIGGYVRLSGAGFFAENVGTHRIVNVDAGTNTCTVAKDTTSTTAFSTNTAVLGVWTLYSRGERVEVSDITSTTVTLTADSAAALQIVAYATSYGAGAFLEVADGVGETATLGPVVIDGESYSGEVTVEVNTAEDLVPTGNTSDTLTLLGTAAPQGWALLNLTASSVGYAAGYSSPRRVMLVADGDSPAAVQVQAPGAGRDLAGWRLRASAIVGCHTTARSVRFDISTDGGDNWSAGSTVAIPLSYYDSTNRVGSLYPVVDPTAATPALVNWRIQQEFEVPPPSELDGALADVRVRLVFVSAAASDIFSVDALTVEVPAHDGQTIVRSPRGESNTHWVYYWPSNDIDESTALGLDEIAYLDVTEPGPGVDNIMPAHVTTWPRATEVAARIGAYTAVDWATVIVSIDTITNNAVYSFQLPNLDGLTTSTVTYTADGSATVAEILTGLTDGPSGVNAFTVDTGISAAALGTSHFVLSSADGTAIEYTSTDTRLTFVSAFTNTDVVDASPLELAVVVPTTATVVEEVLRPSATVPHDATLSLAAAVDGSFPLDPTTDDVLLELPAATGVNAAYTDGIAYPNSNTYWTWQDAETVRIDSSIWSTTSAYALTYRALVRAQSSVYDLSSATADWANFLWLFDAPYWHGAEPEIVARSTQVAGLTFDGDGVAVLAVPAASTSAATLTVNDGRRTRTLSAAAWRWVTNNGLAAGNTSSSAGGGNVSATGVAFAVRLSDPSTFNPDAVYTLTYTAASMSLTDRGAIQFEVRAGATIDACLAATWVRIEPNAPLPLARGVFTGTPANQFFQFRANWTLVADENRTMLWALGAKGIRVRGAAAGVLTTPGIFSTFPSTAYLLAGTSAGVGSASAAFNGALAGSSAGLVALVGGLGATGALTGAGSGTSSVAGTINGALAGSSAGVGTASATVNGALAGSAAGTAAVAGTLS